MTVRGGVTTANRPAVRRLLRAAYPARQDIGSLTLDALASLLQEGRRDGALADVDVSAALAETTSDQRGASAWTPPDSARTPELSDSTDALAQALRNVLATARPTSGPIDETAVRAIVDAAVDARVPRGVTVTGPAGTVEIPGLIHNVFDLVLKAVSAGVPVYLVGPAGAGKTMLAEQVATALKLTFRMNGSLASAFEVTGYRGADGIIVRTAFRDAFETGGLYLADEIDAWDARALLAMNAALSNGYAAFPDGMVKRHPDFRMIAAANTWGAGATAEYVGRSRLDAATLNRFVRVSMDYDAALETAMVPAAHHDWLRRVQSCRKAVRELGVKAVISPRQSLQGAALIAAGWTTEQADAGLLFAGMDAATTDKVRAAMQAKS